MERALQLNNFAELKTGEGKSIVLSIVAAILSLGGFKVTCVCYSEYLVKRDYQNSRKIFEILNVENSIEYLTLVEACASVLKMESLENLIQNLIKGNDKYQKANFVEKFSGNSFLLIDEVDLLFSDVFLKESYTFTARLRHDNINKFLEKLYECVIERENTNRQQKLKYSSNYLIIN